VLFLAFGSALGLTVVDLHLVFFRAFSVIYLGDAVIEVCLVALWVHGWRRARTVAAVAPAVAAPVAASQTGAAAGMRPV
jgi:hypothetical protein